MDNLKPTQPPGQSSQAPTTTAKDKPGAKEPLLALMLAVILPGLGQVYTRRIISGVLFFSAQIVLILATFAYLTHPAWRVSAFLFIPLLGLTLGWLLFVMADAFFGAIRYNRQRNLTRKITPGKTVLLLLGIILAIILHITQPVFEHLGKNIQAASIPKGAMEPTLLPADQVFVDRQCYRDSGPARGEIVLCRVPGNAHMQFVGRVVGLPNENIEINSGKILIAGRVQRNPDILTKIQYQNQGNYGKRNLDLKILPNNYYVLGDNSSVSKDSRYFGLISRQDIVGKVYKIYLPFSRSGPI